MKPERQRLQWPSQKRSQGWHAVGCAVIGAIIISVLNGCSDSGSAKSPPPPRSEPTSAIDQRSVIAKVADVLDGITIEVEIADEFFRVRYLGVEIPTGRDDVVVGSAYRYNRFLVENETIELERGVVNKDADGNYLRYVYVNGEMVNLTMLSGGYAIVSDFPSEFKYLGSYVEAIQRAEQDKRGIWSSESIAINSNPLEGLARFQGGTLPVLDDWRGPQIECDFTNSIVPVIKGKVDAKTGDMYYLVPGSTAYERTFVIESDGDRWFCTELEARAQDFTQSRS
jgi:endonuclease YncB( thermonuclease family)